MTKEELTQKIKDWESDAGESFVDYFMHGINDKDWGLFLINRGFEERGEAIINSYDAHEKAKEFCCQDQNFLYSIHSYPEFTEDSNWNGVLSYECVYDDETATDENYDEDVELWVEFLINSNYLEKVTKFLTNAE